MSEPALVVLDREAYVERLWRERPWPGSAPWYLRLGVLPRAYYNGTDVVVLRGNERNQKLLAHEYGHHLGHGHPYFPMYVLDVMGYGLRVTDIYRVMDQSREWRERMT